MKKILLSILLSLFLCCFVYAQDFGSLKIIPPTKDCIIIVDGIQVGTGTTTVKLRSGEHNIQATFNDGTVFYNGTANVITDEITPVSISYELNKNKTTLQKEDTLEKETVKKDDSGDSELVKQVLKQQQQQQLGGSKKEWGEGFGLSVGIDNANYSEIYKGTSLGTVTLSNQIDFAVFYSLKVSPGLFIDSSLSFYRTLGENPEELYGKITAYPLICNVKYKISEMLMVGGGINFSYWFADPALQGGWFSFMPGYQVCVEVAPISSEIGYIVKHGMINSYDIYSGGIYFKYKLYFD
jgi:hypothetical protein